ncbi:MAG: hypothetical protein B7X34_01225 [Acidobacteriia bacterium 12-62-4]|nr:MAG: hypothetical protein B7X34_01225 [Acidobacteriia bacterium 12-62-4]
MQSEHPLPANPAATSPVRCQIAVNRAGPGTPAAQNENRRPLETPPRVRPTALAAPPPPPGAGASGSRPPESPPRQRPHALGQHA